MIKAISIIALLLWPICADASVFEMFGAGSRGVGMSGALSAAASGGEAAFHNPAMLGGVVTPGAWAGYNATLNDLHVDLARPVCISAYATCRGQYIGGFSARAPQTPRDSQAFMAGWHYPLGGLFRDRVALGAALSLPQGHIIRISGPDPQTPHFPMYEGMPDRIAFLFGASWRVTDWWWVGVGTQVLAVLNAQIDLDLNPTNHTMDNASVRIGLEPRARLTAGTALHPTPWLWLGASYRQRLSLEYKIPTAIDIGSPAHLAIGLGHETLFTPDELHIGASWKMLNHRLLVATDLGLAFWSQAPDPSPQVSLRVSGPAADALGLGPILAVGTDTPAIQLHYSDTLSPAVALEFHVDENWTLRTGYQYRPTPAQRASGPFNYLDNPMHALGAGARFGFGSHDAQTQIQLDTNDRDPAGPAPPLHVDVGAQLQYLPDRSIYKADSNDLVGNLSHGGSVWHVGASFGGTF